MTKCDVRSEPWLTEGAIDFLRHFINPTSRVMETGGGASTVWFAEQCRCSVVTYESDPNYIAIIRSILKPFSRAHLHPFVSPIPPDWTSYSDESFDLVLVDTGFTKRIPARKQPSRSA